MVTAHVLNPDRGDVIARGSPSPAPPAVAYRHRFNRSHPYGWECGVHVFSVPVAGAAYAGTRMSYDCTRSGIARTPEEARAGALLHVTERHPEAAVPYMDRVLRARCLYR